MARKKKKKIDMQEFKINEINEAIRFVNDMAEDTECGGFDDHVKQSILHHVKEFKEITPDDSHHDEHSADRVNFVIEAIAEEFGEDFARKDTDVHWDYVLYNLVEKSAWSNIVADVFVSKIKFLEEKIEEIKEKTKVLNSMPDDVFQHFKYVNINDIKALRNDMMSIVNKYKAKTSKKSNWTGKDFKGDYNDYYKGKFYNG